MDSSCCPSLFPLHRCKTIHLVCNKCILNISCCILRKFVHVASWFEGHSTLSSLLDFAQNFEDYVVLLNNLFRSGMLKEYTMLKEIRTIKFTCHQNILMHILPSWAGGRLEKCRLLNYKLLDSLLGINIVDSLRFDGF